MAENGVKRMNELKSIDPCGLGETNLALCRSILFEAIALGFRPPNEDMLIRLGSVEGTRALMDAALAIDGDDLAGRIQGLAVPEGNGELQILCDAFLKLFGHTAQGSAPPYETEYGSGATFLQPQELADIAGFLGAFGLVIDKSQRERVDHISCECEFLCFLSRKEAYALQHMDRDMLEITRDAQRLFLQDHLGRFAPAFARRVAEEDGAGFYGALADFCGAFIKAECQRLEVEVGSEHRQIRPPSLDDAPMACGTCPELPANQEIAPIECGE